MNIYLRITLTILSALIASCAFPPLNYSPLVLIAWIPLFIALKDLKITSSLLLGLLHGIIFFAVGTSWLLNLFGTPAVILWVILASFTGIFARISSPFCNKGPWYILSTAALWTGLEFFRAEMFSLYFPWLTPGVGFGPSLLSPIIGVYGVTFLIIFGSLLVVSFKKRSLISGGSLLAALFLLYFVTPAPVTPSKPIAVMAMQYELGGQLDKIKLTQEALKESSTPPQIIVWPELAIQGDNTGVSQSYSRALAVAKHFPNSILVSGTQNPQEKGYYNAAVTINGGKVLGAHYKNHPVPLFSEGIKGTDAKSTKTPLGILGTPICYDCDHEDVVRRMVSDGAQLITVPSLDAIHWGEKQHIQHSQLFHHRAAENHRWIVVAASSGMTQIIDPYGNQVAKIPLMEPGILEGQVELLSTRTIYNRFGYLLGPLCFYFACGFAIYSLIFDTRQRLLEKKKQQDKTS